VLLARQSRAVEVLPEYYTLANRLVVTTKMTMEPPSVSVSQVQNCDFARWFSDDNLRKRSIKSVIIPLDKEFTDYLLADGLVLPENWNVYGMVDQSTMSDDEDNGGWGEQDLEEQPRPSFPQLLQSVEEAISSLGGEVFPKLNWSCPKDAAWISGGSLKCRTAGDVAMLLKSSEFIAHDLLHAYDHCSDASTAGPIQFSLILRRWSGLLPAMHFRCFIRDQILVGICQRNCSIHFPFLEEQAKKIHGLLAKFFQDVLKNNFPGPSYVVDLYIDRKDRVWIIDFNVYGPPTDTLLFNWDHIESVQVSEEEEETGQNEEVIRFYINEGRMETLVAVEKALADDPSADNRNIVRGETVTSSPSPSMPQQQQGQLSEKDNSCSAGECDSEASGAPGRGSPVPPGQKSLSSAAELPYGPLPPPPPAGPNIASTNKEEERQGELFTVYNLRGCEVRVVTSAQRTITDPLAEFKGPTDTLGLVGDGGIDFEALKQLCS